MGTIIRAAVVYWVLLLVIRVVGRRSASQMTPFELILLFLLGGISIQAVVADDRSLTNALLGIMTIGLMHVGVAWLRHKYPRFGMVTDGTPIVVYGHGEWHGERMSKMRIDEQDVMSAARQMGLERLAQIKYAIVERNGKISIVKAD
jgi:uncharacterized membrane protein YcaP (DUF421 family)